MGKRRPAAGPDSCRAARPPARPWNEASVISRLPGLYLYSGTDGRPVFLGQTGKNVRERVRQHSAVIDSSRRSLPATFAVQLARWSKSRWIVTIRLRTKLAMFW